MLGKKTSDENDARLKLAAMARWVKSDDEPLLKLVLGSMDEEELIEEGRRFKPLQLVEDAAEIYDQGWKYFMRGGLSATARVRGCSRELLALAARQSLALLDLVEGHQAATVELSRKRERVQRKLRKDFEHAVKLRDQARRVLVRMAASGPRAHAGHRASLGG